MVFGLHEEMAMELGNLTTCIIIIIIIIIITLLLLFVTPCSVVVGYQCFRG
jgi:hypothetical protein